MGNCNTNTDNSAKLSKTSSYQSQSLIMSKSEMRLKNQVTKKNSDCEIVELKEGEAYDWKVGGSTKTKGSLTSQVSSSSHLSNNCDYHSVGANSISGS